MPIVGKNQCHSDVQYVLNRYVLNEDCSTRDCGEPVPLDFVAKVRPFNSRGLGDLERSSLGERAHNMIALIYRPLHPVHVAQVAEGIFLRMSDSRFVTNGYDASVDGGCADELQYQGQSYRPVRVDCAQSVCGPVGSEEEWVCRVYLCLANCRTRTDPSYTTVRDEIFIPAPLPAV